MNAGLSRLRNSPASVLVHVLRLVAGGVFLTQQESHANQGVEKIADGQRSLCLACGPAYLAGHLGSGEPGYTFVLAGENGEQVDVDSLKQHFGCPKTGGNLQDVGWIRRFRHLVGFTKKKNPLILVWNHCRLKQSPVSPSVASAQGTVQADLKLCTHCTHCTHCTTRCLPVHQSATL